MPTPEQQLESYFAKYDPAMAAFGRALRAKLRARLPGLFEIVYVYERQGSLVISYSPSENGYEGILSTALFADRVQLYFPLGGQLAKADTAKLLQGSGKGVRHIVLHSMADFDRPEIEALIAATVQLTKVRLDPGAKGAVVIRAETQKQRASRAKKAATKSAKKA